MSIFALSVDVRETRDSFKIVENYENYQVIATPKIVIRTDSIQKCKLCGKEMMSFIKDHIRDEHPDEYAKEKKA